MNCVNYSVLDNGPLNPKQPGPTAKRTRISSSPYNANLRAIEVKIRKPPFAESNHTYQHGIGLSQLQKALHVCNNSENIDLSTICYTLPGSIKGLLYSKRRRQRHVLNTGRTNDFRMLLGLPRFRSESGMFV